MRDLYGGEPKRWRLIPGCPNGSGGPNAASQRSPAPPLLAARGTSTTGCQGAVSRAKPRQPRRLACEVDGKSHFHARVA